MAVGPAWGEDEGRGGQTETTKMHTNSNWRGRDERESEETTASVVLFIESDESLGKQNLVLDWFLTDSNLTFSSDLCFDSIIYNALQNLINRANSLDRLKYHIFCLFSLVVMYLSFYFILYTRSHTLCVCIAYVLYQLFWWMSSEKVFFICSYDMYTIVITLSLNAIILLFVSSMFRLSFLLSILSLAIGPGVIVGSSIYSLCSATGMETTQIIKFLTAAILGSEILWFFYYRHRTDFLSAQTAIPAPFPKNDDEMFHQIADYIVKHGNVFFPGWFGGRNAEDITESEFRAMFAANYHNKSVAKMSKLQNQQFDSLLKILRDRTGAGFNEEDGSSGRVYYDDTEGFPAGYLQHTRDNLHVIHHPLILYLWSHIAGIASEFVLWGLGFNKECDAETSISYWHKPVGLPVSVCLQRKPIVFAHGMGVGLSAYLHVIWSLCNLSSYTMDAEEAVDNRDVYLMDFPHIAMRICDDVPTVDTINETIRNFLRNDGHASASFVGHSYGSVILARMAKTYPHLMHTSIYIDPICFLLYIPKVVNSFVYRKPDNHWFQWARYYGCSRELYMQNVLCRNFWWYQYNMHPTEIPANSLVVASMKDDIVPSDLVVDHIKHLSPETKLMMPDYYHAEFMAHPYFIGDLMTQLVALEDGVELTKQRKDKVFAA